MFSKLHVLGCRSAVFNWYAYTNWSYYRGETLPKYGKSNIIIIIEIKKIPVFSFVQDKESICNDVIDRMLQFDKGRSSCHACRTPSVGRAKHLFLLSLERRKSLYCKGLSSLAEC